MGLVLTSPPATEPVSVAEAKAHLRIGHADEDQLVSRLIIAARRLAEARTGLALISQGWSLFLDDWPAMTVALAPWPVLTLNDIKLYGDDNTAAVVDPAHYYLDKVSRPARLVLRGSRVWARPGRVANGIEILLTAGFGPAATDVPAPLREAMLHLIAQWYARRGDMEEEGVPLAVAALIAPFREVRL